MTEQILNPPKRITSIDALRGFTMFWIIGGDRIMRSLPELSNNIFFTTLDQQLRHVEWIGFHFYDLIFPMFLFLIGVVQPFSIGSRLKKGAKKSDLYKHIFLRAVTMFVLGLIYYGIKDPNLKTLGYYGVLQLLAVGYFFSSLIMINTKINGIIYWAFGIIILYSLSLKFIPVPGFGAGNLTPEGNFSNYIGSLASDVLSPKFRKLFTPYILSPISTGLIGILAGYWIQKDNSPLIKVKGLIFGGTILIFCSMVLSLWIPVIKNLWSGSFVLLTAGISSVLLGVFYWIIDVKGYSRWAFFFIVIGLNPITVYFLARIIDFRAIVTFFLLPLIPYLGKFESFIMACGITLMHWLFVYWLYKRKIFIKL